MTVRLNPYLHFRGEARQAAEHYRSVFGGELELSTFGESGMAADGPDADLVMHAMLTSPDGLVLMVSDVPEGMGYEPGSDITVSLSGGPDDEAALRGYWDGLVDGGTVEEPLVTAPWGDTFGMCKDRFGKSWMVNIGGAAQG